MIKKLLILATFTLAATPLLVQAAPSINEIHACCKKDKKNKKKKHNRSEKPQENKDAAPQQQTETQPAEKAA